MRKIASALVSLSLLLPMVALAQEGPATQCTMSYSVGVTGCPGPGSVCNFTTNSLCGLCCVLNAIYTVTTWLFFLLLAVTALLVIWGGFTIATAGGAAEKVSSGRNYILYAMIGLAIALLSRAIPALVKVLMGLA